ncbi:hypothetical protein NGC65_00780 [Staphylococcus xylosus]|uniref:hypothetical protein n=1 Tax=Staphylococcus xylosus TaxID=1288 RepID=UPI002DB784E7|nr:hypothetical protein [Staphylococcus xylosus]MEB6291620.1 hypothetical protein [Staphylococcus xylosus]MEB7719778.1 hypothetical protein [Staphylococcus xylosus]MEB7812938.1 hypothetical protein [Staphylococcus xylosus]MEB7820956.1 hypothetical protein [Staphylococcus xylosus]MEB7836720.1 hypothetical protein [Staphylococcus xylosus]
MKDKLHDYVGKNVKIVDIDDWEFIGLLVHFDDIEKSSNRCSYQVKTDWESFDILESEVKSISRIELNSESLRVFEYLGKRVKVILWDGERYMGKVIDFDWGYDNATGYDSIYLKTDTGSFDIDEYEIKSIKEIE